MRITRIHKSEGFIYNLFVNPCYLALHGLFRRIEIFGKERLPVDAPLIIVANHPTAFVDPILFCCLFDEPMYNMTRGDIFEKPIANRLLRSMNMFPIYRARDGYSGHKRNQKVFDEILRRLNERKTIVIYAEGQHHLDTSLMPLQKGVDAVIQHVLHAAPNLHDLQVIPIGVNYRHGDRAWDDVSIIIGEPFPALPFLSDHQPSDERQLPLLTALTTRLRMLVHHLDHKKDQSLFDLGKEMIRSEVEMPLLPQAKLNKRLTFDREHLVAYNLNQLNEAEKNDLRTLAATYENELKKNKFRDLEVYRNGRTPAYLLPALVLGLFPFLIGYLGALPIILATRYAVRKFVKKREFITSVQLGLGVLVGVIWYVLAGLIGILSFNPYIMAICLSLPLLGWFTNVYQDWYQQFARARNWSKYTGKDSLVSCRAILRNKLLTFSEV